ncbi:MAG: GT2 family glycosyltransferase [Roseivirga sp.]|jgi:GT2 family glycosyltransferase
MLKLTVAILNYNGKKHLSNFLPSVVANSLDYEVVVIDNGSTDDSVEFLDSHFPEIKAIKFSENYGFCGGYNKAIQLIDSEYIVLLNTDVEVTPNWIAPVLSLLESDPTIAAAQPKILDYKSKKHFEYAGAAGGFLDVLGYPFCRGRIFHTIEEDHHQYQNVTDVLWASGASLFVRKKAYLDAGGLDEDFFAHMEEIDLCWRFWNSGYKVKVCPQSTVYHLGGGTLDKSSPKKTYLNFRNGLSILLKNETGSALIWKLPIRISLDWIAIFQFSVLSGYPHGFAIIKAHWSFFTSLNGQLKKRKFIKRSGHNNPKYEGSIIWDYFVSRKKVYSKINP